MNLFSKITNWFKECFKDWKPIPLSELDSTNKHINPAAGLSMVDPETELSTVDPETGFSTANSVTGFSTVNPATGLPMADECIDINGNLYGSSDNQ